MQVLKQRYYTFGEERIELSAGQGDHAAAVTFIIETVKDIKEIRDDDDVIDDALDRFER